ncbi:MAG: hypothetical protein A3H88_03540 [Candidatus Blackburnbacteria bacterium RIFCSPLOWO2_02_FULL_44_9]|uniref:Glycosyl transferase family 1 domain-containing protein n=1 Tax=Candidatus Blackburnbacteria bacterium RIFCSPHIGHO2_02_FULL_44_20 TaxID=1797516 RepID=A0A1G1V8K9_9BACT|nr:MAG: hypothetical protein A3E16_01025 [Candidatus Blackburnbacteria bacterium RIFCSPHIGHO2_12_FULL_44_25]OGY11788.1 MAG: hypothetical protein A3D26_01620 [Candidatus Blackburnbacteria bacterium RIFCSPHIGHO2_02_FULL_44_20]OGY15618.1 MAG: hypothetical protein A3H88_03540 [Candidatus Blackburnbacteria bacterium RIFCSPLOWO2_02_FULL_44_9]
MIKVFVNKSPLETAHSTRGIGLYTKELTTALKENKNIQLVDDVTNADIIHHPFFDLFFPTLPEPHKKIPTVVTVHDVIPLIYPNQYKPGVRGRIRFLRQKERLRKVNALLTDSETSKKDIVRLLSIPAEKIFVTHLAPASHFRQLTAGNWELETKKHYDLPEHFVLYVGDVNYNKNIGGLLQAVSLLDKTNVVMVGKAFQTNIPEARQITEQIRNLKLEKRVTMPGFVPNDDLVKLYNLATAVCQPSLYEGFGLPILEAQACETPVVANKTQALVEIAGNSVLFAGNKPNDLAQKLKNLLTDTKLQTALRKRGRENIKRFSWQKTARKTLKVYEKVLGI